MANSRPEQRRGSRSGSGIAHENAVQNLAARHPGETPPPAITYRSDYELHLGGVDGRARALVKQGVPKCELLATGDSGWRLNLTPDQLDHSYAEISQEKDANP